MKFRLGCWKLAVHTGKVMGVPRHERVCMLCDQHAVEDERHVVFECSKYDGLRMKNKYSSLFAHTDMIDFFNQSDQVSLADFLDEVRCSRG